MLTFSVVKQCCFYAWDPGQADMRLGPNLSAGHRVTVTSIRIHHCQLAILRSSWETIYSLPIVYGFGWIRCTNGMVLWIANWVFRRGTCRHNLIHSRWLRYSDGLYYVEGGGWRWWERVSLNDADPFFFSLSPSASDSECVLVYQASSLQSRPLIVCT